MATTDWHRILHTCPLCLEWPTHFAKLTPNSLPHLRKLLNKKVEPIFLWARDTHVDLVHVSNWCWPHSIVPGYVLISSITVGFVKAEMMINLFLSSAHRGSRNTYYMNHVWGWWGKPHPKQANRTDSLSTCMALSNATENQWNMGRCRLPKYFVFVNLFPFSLVILLKASNYLPATEFPGKTSLRKQIKKIMYSVVFWLR